MQPSISEKGTDLYVNCQYRHSRYPAQCLYTAGEYDPFEDAPKEGEFDTAGFFRNLAIGLGVAIACVGLALIPGIFPHRSDYRNNCAWGCGEKTCKRCRKKYDKVNHQF
jgi:hypothetical protein